VRIQDIEPRYKRVHRIRELEQITWRRVEVRQYGVNIEVDLLIETIGLHVSNFLYETGKTPKELVIHPRQAAILYQSPEVLFAHDSSHPRNPSYKEAYIFGLRITQTPIKGLDFILR